MTTTTETAPILWHRSPLVFLALALALLVTWSSGFIGVRFAGEHLSVPGILFWRSILPGLILLPFALRGPKITAKILRDQALYAFLGMFLYLGSVALSISYRVPTGLVALMADMVPLAIALMSLPLLGQRLTQRQWLGSGIAVAGVVFVSYDTLQIGNAPLAAYLLPVVGLAAFALSAVLQKRRNLGSLPVVQILCLQCLFAAAMFAPFAAAAGDLVPPMTRHFAFAMLWLVFLTTLAGWGVYYLCLRLWTAVQFSAVVYLAPPMTMLWAAAMFDEPLTSAMFIGLAVTLAGVWLVTIPKARS